MKSSISHSLLVVASLAAISAVHAAPITVVNYDFETLYKPGSTTVTTTLNATVDPTKANINQANPMKPNSALSYAVTFSDATTGSNVDVPGWYSGGRVIDWGAAGTVGQQTGYVEPVTGISYIAQALSVSLLANTEYTLSIDAKWMGYGGHPTMALDLYGGVSALNATHTRFDSSTDGSTNLTSSTFTSLTSAWTTYTVTFTTGASPVAGTLGIQIATQGGGSSSPTQYDNIRLDATAVPEPATWGLLGVGLMTVMFVRRRRFVEPRGF